jgi:hypothetical protein
MLKRFALPALVVGLFALAAPAICQEHYTDGPIWRVTYLNVKPGKMGDTLKDLRANFAKISGAAKAAGLIADYKVFLNPTSNGPTDWNVATAILYKNWAALDGLTAQTEALTLKHYGTAEARQKANDARLDLWTVNSSNLAREVTLR